MRDFEVSKDNVQLTPQQVRHFRRTFAAYMEAFGLGHWHVIFSLEADIPGAYADIAADDKNAVARLRLSKNWGNTRAPSPANLEFTARHEAVHALVAAAEAVAMDRHASKDEISREHEKAYHKTRGVAGMSKHEVRIVQIKMEPHPNADELSIVRPVGAFTVCVRSADWRDGALAAYIEPDMVVPDTADFAWLCPHTRPEGSFVCRSCRRIRARRFRGVWSMGLLVPAPAGAQPYQEVMEKMGITRYEPPVEAWQFAGGPGPMDAEAPPPGVVQVYDVENWYHFPDVFLPGERLVVTEKVHGANARFTWREGRMWAGSRRRWLKGDERSAWWRIAAQYPEIQAMCQVLPGYTLYGEIYGMQDLRYGVDAGQLRFVAFDVQTDTGLFRPYPVFQTIMQTAGIPTVPEIARLHYDGQVTDALLQSLAPGDSLLAPGQIREGVVVRPYEGERWDPRAGRVQLKLVSNAYLQRAK